MTVREKDLYYLSLAWMTSLRSKCKSRKLGAVLVKDDQVISTGYNGAPRRSNICQENKECLKRWSGDTSGASEWCPAVHAELNALLQAARHGSSTKGAVMYCACGVPCKDCFGAIINAGITEIVCLDTGHYSKLTKLFLGEDLVLLRTISEDKFLDHISLSAAEIGELKRYISTGHAEEKE